MWIESPWSSLMWGLSGPFLSQTSVVVGKYIDILATCKSHSTLDKGLFLHFVNRRVGLRWGAGDISSQAKRILVNTQIHFLLVILGCLLQVGVMFPFNLPVSSWNLKCSLFKKHVETSIIFSQTLISSGCLVPSAVSGYENEIFLKTWFLQFKKHIV